MAQQEHGLSRRRACRLIGISRSVAERAPKRERDHARLRERLHALAGERRRFGYRRLHELLRREGFVANHKLVHRLYQEEKLALRRRGRQKRGLGGAMAGSWCPIAANQRWSLDFTEDCLANRRRFRTANLKDDCTRECPAILVDFSLPGRRVVDMLEDVARERGYPDMLARHAGRRQWTRAARPRPGPLGVRARGAAVLHRPRQAGAERLDRELQRSLP